MFHQNQLVGRYRIVKSIGSGGFGTVFLAEDTWLTTQVALKVPHQQTAQLEVLLAEAQVLARLDHPNIVRLHTAAREEGIFFLVMEYVAGETLSDRIDRDGPLPLGPALALFEQVAAAVEHAHQRSIVHRDLRPANVLLVADDRAKVLDFGIGKLLGRNGHAITRIGSPPYMAPEQFAGRTSFPSDVYSLGVVLYEMLTGTLPIAEVQAERVRQAQLRGAITPPKQRNPALPDHVDRAVMKAMALQVPERFQSAPELVAALRARPLPAAAEGLREIRARLKAQAAGVTPARCWNCHRALARRASRCAHCGEEPATTGGGRPRPS